jgi:ATPase subunit of ABC transporter with duplicated ATPase domains
MAHARKQNPRQQAAGLWLKYEMFSRRSQSMQEKGEAMLERERQMRALTKKAVKYVENNRIKAAHARREDTRSRYESRAEYWMGMLKKRAEKLRGFAKERRSLKTRAAADKKRMKKIQEEIRKIEEEIDPSKMITYIRWHVKVWNNHTEYWDYYHGAASVKGGLTVQQAININTAPYSVMGMRGAISAGQRQLIKGKPLYDTPPKFQIGIDGKTMNEGRVWVYYKAYGKVYGVIGRDTLFKPYPS